MSIRNSQYFLFIFLLFCVHFSPISSVIVDGKKKNELSALKRQKTNESLAIDSFNTKTCGLSDPNSNEHEFVNMAREGQFPWIVSFQIRILSRATYDEQLEESTKPLNNSNTMRKPATKREEPDLPGARKIEDLHFCGGSIISDKWILSAAHCFTDSSIENYFLNDKLFIVAGSNKVSSRAILNKNLTIKRIYYHDKFNKSLPVGYDIALVELSDKIIMETERDKNEFGEQKSSFMNSICLPKGHNEYKVNESARIAGWGLSRAKEISTMPSKLLTTDILLSDHEECAKIYAKRLKSTRPFERKDYICASFENVRDACQSDSGTPLMQFVQGKAVAIGIVSFGVGCATNGIPGLYTKTSAHIDWIKDITLNGQSASVSYKLIEVVGKVDDKQKHTKKNETDEVSDDRDDKCDSGIKDVTQAKNGTKVESSCKKAFKRSKDDLDRSKPSKCKHEQLPHRRRYKLRQTKRPGCPSNDTVNQS